HDAIVYDLTRVAPVNVYIGARLLRQSNMWRSYQLAGTAVLPPPVPGKSDTITLTGPRGSEPLSASTLHGYDRLADGVRIRWRWRFASAVLEVEDTLRIQGRRLVRELRGRGLPGGTVLEVHVRVPAGQAAQVLRLGPDGSNPGTASVSFDL